MNAPRARRPAGPGFTIVELMIVVAVLGVLSAIAYPIYARNVRRSQTSEATMNLTHLYDGALTYWAAEHTATSGAVQNHLFPVAVGPSPSASCCAGVDGQCAPVPADWSAPTWQALSFLVADRHRYRYSVNVNGNGSAAGHWLDVTATGDLNCNGVFGVFTRRVNVVTMGGRVDLAVDPQSSVNGLE